jgi:hypothetical protein
VPLTTRWASRGVALESLARRCSRGCWPRQKSTSGYRDRQPRLQKMPRQQTMFG